jgi:PAS domain-containing protein
MIHNSGRQPLWPGEVHALVNACEASREKLVILALLETGFTAEELTRLTARSIDWREGTLRGCLKRDPASLSVELLSLLKQHFQTAARLGIGNRQIQRIVRAVGRRAGLKTTVTPDILRRTCLWNPLRSNPVQVRDARGRILLEAADAAADIIFVADDERRYVDMNQAAADALGLPREAVIGRSIDDFFSEARAQPVPLASERFLSDSEQHGICKLRNREDALFEYRAKANFVPGLHVSVLRPVAALAEEFPIDLGKVPESPTGTPADSLAKEPMHPRQSFPAKQSF